MAFTARIFFVLFCSAILTLWVPGYLPVALFKRACFYWPPLSSIGPVVLRCR